MSNKNSKEEESTMPRMELDYPYRHLQIKYSRTNKPPVGKLAKNVFNDENESETPKLNSQFKLVFGGFKQKE